MRDKDACRKYVERRNGGEETQLNFESSRRKMKFYTRHKSLQREYYRICKSGEILKFKINFRNPGIDRDIWGNLRSGCLFFRNLQISGERNMCTLYKHALTATYPIFFTGKFSSRLTCLAFNERRRVLSRDKPGLIAKALPPRCQ